MCDGQLPKGKAYYRDVVNMFALYTQWNEQALTRLEVIVKIGEYCKKSWLKSYSSTSQIELEGLSTSTWEELANVPEKFKHERYSR
mgnify:CR=1 FL=1